MEDSLCGAEISKKYMEGLKFISGGNTLLKISVIHNAYRTV
jgi:hypothetical protein